LSSSSPVALVTGASRGIGRAIAVELASAGYDIVVNFVSRPEAAEETAALIADEGRETLLAQADISSTEDRASMIEETRSRFGRIDVLVNNAALAPRERVDLLESSEEHYDRTLDVNLKGPFFLTQSIARWMVEERLADPDRKLYIVNISSLSEYTSSVLRGDYCLAKAGLGMLTSLFADRLGEHNIPVNEIRPGIIATDMTAGAKEKYDKLFAEGLTPFRRWGQPEDVARAVRALVGGDFDFATGSAIDLDGGFHLHRL
jgi:NAD(P)-dependent dehydrogenase (short-subunit alcohol dehydrogenase family)|tara:strand:- start:3 stop:782 length:780 start_codon:yes stop_codon:yes gene_type:complete